jgi:hypothetical protein
MRQVLFENKKIKRTVITMKIVITYCTVLVLLGIGFSNAAFVFAAEEKSSIMCDNGVVNIGDKDADVQHACGEPNSQNYKLNAWVYNFGPSQPVYTVIFKEGKVVRILEDEWGS